jgi:hypothetical protein
VRLAIDIDIAPIEIGKAKLGCIRHLPLPTIAWTIP